MDCRTRRGLTSSTGTPLTSDPSWTTFGTESWSWIRTWLRKVKPRDRDTDRGSCQRTPSSPLTALCFRGSGGVRVLQHRLSGEAGEREDTGQREPDVSGAAAEPTGLFWFKYDARQCLCDGLCCVSLRVRWNTCTESCSARRRSSRRWCRPCRTAGSSSRCRKSCFLSCFESCSSLYQNVF